ncbi:MULTISPECIES: hypothetical protein [Cyanophyceae]|jgi:hypothetical protein|uniref:hypothetical protein n=1 Tax=Cyanophyceae TaxID=3028117 RepID=UPI0016838E30|nr:hypothetical protein [Trichocoleus sp. FACHB-40]MBD2005807.1 hypothetical protein [Trichocoleus sp. FACHB-40]
MMNKKNFDCLLKALEITEIVLALFAFSQPLGIAAGTAILGYLYLMPYNNENDEDENQD